MRKILKFLLVTQEVKRATKLGTTPRKMRRINPYNPLSYVVILLVFVLGILCFGIIGFWKEIDGENPFKYN